MYLVCRLLPAPPLPAICSLSLHDALPIFNVDEVSREAWRSLAEEPLGRVIERYLQNDLLRGLVLTDAKVGIFTYPHDPSLVQNRCFLYTLDRKSTRLNSSHRCISYAVFCLLLPSPRSALFPYTTLFRSSTSMRFPAKHGVVWRKNRSGA